MARLQAGQSGAQLVGFLRQGGRERSGKLLKRRRNRPRSAARIRTSRSSNTTRRRSTTSPSRWAGQPGRERGRAKRPVGQAYRGGQRRAWQASCRISSGRPAATRNRRGLRAQYSAAGSSRRGPTGTIARRHGCAWRRGRARRCGHGFGRWPLAAWPIAPTAAWRARGKPDNRAQRRGPWRPCWRGRKPWRAGAREGRRAAFCAALPTAASMRWPIAAFR
jgi:hypothetical protein